MDEQAKTSIVRIYKRQGDKAWPIGCGFLANARTILTCRHVISEALRPETDLMEKEVELDFPFPHNSARLKARVIMESEQPDLAKLELLSSPPEAAIPIPLSLDLDLWLHPYSAYGITRQDQDGFWDNGKIKSSIGDRTIQIESESVYKIEQGFSGTAVWDDKIRRAVGMVAKIDIDPQTKATKGAFAIPIVDLLEKCPELKLLADTVQSMGGVGKLPSADIYVGSRTDADYRTIREAIDAASPNSRICIKPGTYRESLVVRKRLSIIGIGNPGTINVVADGNSALLFESDQGQVANIAFKQSGSNEGCIDISDGRLIVENCRISSRNGPCITVSHNADPLIRRNTIHDSQGNGVYFKESSRGTMEGNDIYGNSRSGVIIETSADPCLNKNRIHDGLASGIHIRNGGKGTIVGNDIYGNALAGVTVGRDAIPVLKENTIHDGKANGVFLHDHCKGKLIGNDIYRNSRSNVVIETGADPCLKSNRIHDGLASGIHIREGGKGIIVDNEISHNALAGVTIEGGSAPLLKQNRILYGKGDGIYIFNKGLGNMEENEISANAFCGVVARDGSRLILYRNKINENLAYGIAIDSYSGGVIKENDLHGNRKGPFKIDENPEINRRINREIANNSEEQ